MYKREVPKLNKENSFSQKIRMRLRLFGFGDNSLYYLDHQYSAPNPPITIEKTNQKKKHNILTIDIAYALNDTDFDDVKNCAIVKEMCDKLILVHGGDQNLLRYKVEILRGKYDDMRMKGGENIVQYVNQLKEVVSVIKVVGGVINNEEVVSKVLITNLPIYAIRVFTI